MKTLITGLCSLFAFLMALTFYVAGKSNDGLVEDDYYRKAAGYLAAKEDEERMGLTVRVPGRLETGANRLSVEIMAGGEGVRGARAVLRAMRLSGPEKDRTVLLREDAAGMYSGDIDLPDAGEWMLHLSVEGEGISAQRRWIATAGTRGAGGDKARDIHAGPVVEVAEGQTVILDIRPKPVEAMKTLEFLVDLPGYDGPGAPILDLGMPEMRMPPNRVDLVRTAPGRYRGTGVIVRCASGKRTRSATVTLPGGARTVFTFDVAR